MKITPFGIIFIVISILAIFYIFKRLRQDLLGLRSAAIWLVLWGGVGIFSLFPGLLDVAMRITQMGNRMFFVLLNAVVILFALLFNLSARTDRLERNIAKAIQELAILKSSDDLHDISSKSNDG